MRFLRFFSWQFWATFALTLMVIFIVYTGFEATHESNVKTQQVNTLIGYTKQQADEFTHDRDALLIDQGLLLTYTKQLAEREDALLAYLRTHGITLPERLVTEITPPKLIYVTKPPAATAKGGGAGHKPGRRSGGHK